MTRLLFFITLIFSGWSALATPPVSAYRVLHASPQEIKSALFSPLTAQQLNSTRNPRSRLGKYFRFKSKTLRGDELTLELLPVVPQVEEYLPSTQPIKISLKQKESKENSFTFDSHIEIFDGKFFKALVQLSPHESGSLLSLQLMETNISESLIKIFYFTSTQLGFLNDSQKQAIQKDQERK